MVNFSGLRKRFFQTPSLTGGANVTPNSKLETNVRAYVNGYLKNRNTPNKVPVLNKSMVNALHTYINSKRARTAGAVVGVLGNANATEPVQQAGGLAAMAVNPTAKPNTAAQQVGVAVTGAGGNPTQAVAGAAQMAQKQALQQGMTSTGAQKEAVKAAVEAAVENTSTPGAAAQTAAAGVLAAGGNTTNANKAAKLAALSAVLNKFKDKNNTWYSNKNRNLNALNKEVNNASRNINLNANTRARLNNVKSRLKNAMNAKATAPAPTRATVLKNQASQPEPSNEPVANNRKNMLKTLTNLTTNAIVNARIKEIRGKNPNAKWNNVNANGLTNGQKKVLNGLKMGKNYTGIVRQPTPPANNISQGN